MCKEQLLMKKITELIRSSTIVGSRIIRFMNKDSIITVDDFMNIRKPGIHCYNRKFVMMGPKTFQRIEEIQRIIAKKSCEFCRLNALRTKALESDDIEVVKEALKEFSKEWLNVSQDLNYHKCILDGSWSTAEEILTRSLEKAKLKTE